MYKLPMINGDGLIDRCPHEGCGFHCCQFNQNNYIVLYPSELEEARLQGRSLQHLQIIDTDYFGGQRAVCMAADTSTCDGGYKPLDCATYPFFPTIGIKDSSAERMRLIKGSKCPLRVEDIRDHAEWVLSVWRDVMVLRPEVAEWLHHVKLVGYEPVPDEE